MARLLVTTVSLFSCGCTVVSQPPKPFADDRIRNGDRAAYLWSSGKDKQPALSMQDYAVVTQIDDAVIPAEYRPAAGMEPLVAWRIEIPAGNHVIEILNKETAFCLTGFLGPACTVVEKSLHRVEFTAQPGRAYVPVVDDKCDRKWVWIADSGESLPAGVVKMSPLPFSDRMTAVGGETPPDGPCQSQGSAAAGE
jgi:hypothetical protein